MYKARLGECVDHDQGAKLEYGYVETDPTGRYGRFKEVLGKGAMKKVYRAFDEVLGMEVAWNQAKLNDVLQSPEELQRLYSEVHLLSTLNHDSIIQFYTSWIDVHRRTFNFITEMFTSGTLREYRQRYKRMDIRAVKNWARQILHGLVYLHENDPPVIHRDLKCDNIFVNGHLGQVKIGDLGFAAILRGSQPAHSVIGTPEFMAPELYEEEYNELVDVYSFGMCVLEMLTSEYPYSECSNPAQIYKKVTSGKLPAAFYRIQDLEAQRFVGKCLETASKRLPAKDLLLDPFLASDGGELLLNPRIGCHKPIRKVIAQETLPLRDDPTRRTDMTITGTMNPDDDTIFLKVQIADKDGGARNIYFPFDNVSDTPIDVATEMVKDLEITDREPFEIAVMIEDEISALVPNWKKEWELPQLQLPHHHSFSYQDDDDEPHHPFYSSSCSSSQASPSQLISSRGTHFCREQDRSHGCDCFQDDLFVDDDGSSQSSLYSGEYTNVNYCSINDHEMDMNPRRAQQHPIAKTHKSTRFCPQENQRTCKPNGSDYYKQCKVFLDSVGASSSNDQRMILNRRLTRNRSLVDVRSQLLHRSLVEEVNKRRLSKTVGAVENIGFQSPYELSGKASRPMVGACSVRAPRDGKKQGLKRMDGSLKQEALKEGGSKYVGSRVEINYDAKRRIQRGSTSTGKHDSGWHYYR
ncbi:hypothetical protein HHK36_010588 [Tetracentron sinense]|uniref:non-specific serine/threonine protein kinase n=1 Tax=Tetracentron sinense TaxID=13715 RepID=A0A834ZC93_TETSI|nr:hypothetical protein HHK36_010588 [Tetracentron sinense]